MTLDTAVEPFSAPARPELSSSADRVGILLAHGFTGSPASLRPWGQYLAGEGYAVEVPRLPGHGTTWQEMNATGWDDWYAEVVRAFDKLVAENDQVVVAGLSMGGALALKLAAERPDDVRGVILVNPAVTSKNKQLLAVPVAKHVLKSMPGIGNDIKKPGADEHCYDRIPLRALASFMAAWKPLRSTMADVRGPLLLFRSAEDHVVDPSSAALIMDTVASRDVRERMLTDSFHVATIDNDAPAIFEESLAFVRQVTATD